MLINQIPAQPVIPLDAFQARTITLAFSASVGKAQEIPRSVNSIVLCKKGSVGIPEKGNGIK